MSGRILKTALIRNTALLFSSLSSFTFFACSLLHACPIAEIQLLHTVSNSNGFRLFQNDLIREIFHWQLAYISAFSISLMYM